MFAPRLSLLYTDAGAGRIFDSDVGALNVFAKAAAAAGLTDVPEDMVSEKDEKGSELPHL